MNKIFLLNILIFDDLTNKIFLLNILIGLIGSVSFMKYSVCGQNIELSGYLAARISSDHPRSTHLLRIFDKTKTKTKTKTRTKTKTKTHTEVGFNVVLLKLLSSAKHGLDKMKEKWRGK